MYTELLFSGIDAGVVAPPLVVIALLLHKPIEGRGVLDNSVHTICVSDLLWSDMVSTYFDRPRETS